MTTTQETNESEPIVIKRENIEEIATRTTDDLSDIKPSTESISQSSKKKTEAKPKSAPKSKQKKSSENSKKPSTAEKKVQPAKTKKVVGKAANEKKDCDELEQIILDFMITKTRPYTASELVITFKNEGTKNDILKACANLADEGSLIKKDYGRTIVYLGAKQFSNMPEDQIKKLQEECTELKIMNKNLSDEVCEINKNITKLCEYPKNDDLESIIKSKLKEIEDNKSRFLDLTEGRLKVEKKDMEKVDKELSKLRKILKERNLIFKNAFETLLENCGMKKDEFREEIGLED